MLFHLSKSVIHLFFPKCEMKRTRPVTHMDRARELVAAVRYVGPRPAADSTPLLERLETRHTAYNLKTGRAYTGCNITTLFGSTRHHGHKAAVFLTRTQAIELGGSIPFGVQPQAEVVLHRPVAKYYELTSADLLDAEVTHVERYMVRLRYRVFHMSQVVNVPPEVMERQLKKIADKEARAVSLRLFGTLRQLWPDIDAEALASEDASAPRVLFQECLRRLPDGVSPAGALWQTLVHCQNSGIPFYIPDHPDAHAVADRICGDAASDTQLLDALALEMAAM